VEKDKLRFFNVNVTVFSNKHNFASYTEKERQQKIESDLNKHGGYAKKDLSILT